jgi:hypothetical protein
MSSAKVVFASLVLVAPGAVGKVGVDVQVVELEPRRVVRGGVSHLAEDGAGNPGPGLLVAGLKSTRGPVNLPQQARVLEAPLTHELHDAQALPLFPLAELAVLAEADLDAEARATIPAKAAAPPHQEAEGAPDAAALALARNPLAPSPRFLRRRRRRGLRTLLPVSPHSSSPGRERIPRSGPANPFSDPCGLI